MASLDGGPTKRFFVSMLTRDIEANDAILDLIDNSVDGAMRASREKLDQRKPFDGFVVNLIVNEQKFEINDNCGGIPDDYIEDAFRLGRPNIDKDGDLPTIGMYGIGMKRAIFKFSKSAIVLSDNGNKVHEIEYSSEWLDPDNDSWSLPYEVENSSGGERGVEISSENLKHDIAKLFSSSSFINSLQREISEHFGYIMQRGLRIFLNGEELKSRVLSLLSVDDFEQAGIAPYDYFFESGGLSIRVTVGLFRPLSREDEIDAELNGPSEREVAGISVICNDRVILLHDRSMRTGWGDGGVPQYHPQFRSIAGFAVFTSSDADLLPVSTTKRGLDVGDESYLKARKALIEGIKTFTDFTNKWKGMESEANEYFKQAKRKDARSALALAKDHGQTIRGGGGARRYSPSLPLPEKSNPRRRISFVRGSDEVKAVSEYLFGENEHPSVVGAECFDKFLEKAKK